MSSAEEFGVDEFLNPKDFKEPIPQVIYRKLRSLIPSASSADHHEQKYKWMQVIKKITDGGADYCFECAGDTGAVTAALQSCCDVIPDTTS